MKCEFEEKDFEGPLYGELRYGSHRIATPGQVFEGRFGIDAALEALNPGFWSMFGYRGPLSGVVLEHHNWGFIWRRLGRKRLLPTFSVNLLVQAKRPYIRKRARGVVSDFGIKGRHWIFDITAHQHSILIEVSRRLRQRALLLYAAPAFDTLSELYNFTESEKIVENSSFVRVSKLDGHHSWAYNQAGTVGVGHSEPEEIDDSSFAEMLAELRGERDEKQSPADNLEELASIAMEVCNSERQSNPTASYFVRQIDRMRAFRRAEYEGVSAVDNFLTFAIFCRIFGSEWLVP